jgi:hypothetical protein
MALPLLDISERFQGDDDSHFVGGIGRNGREPVYLRVAIREEKAAPHDKLANWHTA